VAGPGLAADQARLSQSMVRYWTRFARTGNPNSSQTPAWPRYGASQRFQSLVPPAPSAATGFGVEHQCSFWGSQ
jgi:para-nitrobenzyl esterase